MKSIKKITSVILTIVMVLGVVTVAPFSVSAASCIKTQNEALTWLNSQEGARHDLDNSYGSQCSDFVSAYVNWLLYGSTTAGRFGVYNANYYSTKSLYPSDWQVFQNTASFVPQPGDIFITSGTTSFGHTGVVVSSTVNTATIVDQNGMGDWSLENGSPTHIHNITWTSSGTWSPKYFIRPAFAAAGHNPEGVVDVIKGGNGKIHIRGWAFDRDDLGAQLPIHVYIGGRSGDPNAESYVITANTQRTDVNATYGCGDWHGFDAEIKTSKIGTQGVYIYALNIGAGTTNPQIGEGTANISAYQVENPIDLGSLFYAKLAHSESGKFITQENPNGLNHSNVALYQDDYEYEKSYQLWKFERQSDLSYKITNTITGHCLDVYNAVSTNGTNIQACFSNDSNAQRWYFVYGNGSAFSLVPKCAQNSAMDLSNNNSSEGTNIQIYQQSNSSAQLFDVYKVEYSLGKTKFNGNTYELFNLPVSWNFAKEICEEKGGHLATFTTEEEFNVVKEMLAKHSYPTTWIGATSENGNWEWITGENFSYTNWDNGQPDNYDNTEHYATTWGNAKWNDYSLDNKAVICYVCEFEYGPTGDINQNNVIDISDATELQKHLAQLSTLTEEQLDIADTNGNGSVDIQDVTTIQKYLVGAIDYFPKDVI